MTDLQIFNRKDICGFTSLQKEKVEKLFFKSPELSGLFLNKMTGLKLNSVIQYDIIITYIDMEKNKSNHFSGYYSYPDNPGGLIPVAISVFRRNNLSWALSSIYILHRASWVL